jgi:hypothetical protein
VKFVSTPLFPFACLAYFVVKTLLPQFPVKIRVHSRPFAVKNSRSVSLVSSRENGFANRCKSMEAPFSFLMEGEAHEDSC